MGYACWENANGNSTFWFRKTIGLYGKSLFAKYVGDDNSRDSMVAQEFKMRSEKKKKLSPPSGGAVGFHAERARNL